MRGLIEAAPLLTEHLDQESQAHFAALRAGLDALGVAYEVNPRLVRGLDYYSRTVFEWVTDALGAQDAVCSGGRYDGLITQLGGEATPAIGFAMGIERVVELLSQAGRRCRALPRRTSISSPVASGRTEAMRLAEQLRDALPGRGVLLNLGGGNFKTQFRRADRSGARLALILGDAELDRGVAAVKPLRAEGGQIDCPLHELPARIASLYCRAWGRSTGGRVSERKGAVGAGAGHGCASRARGSLAGVALALAATAAGTTGRSGPSSATSRLQRATSRRIDAFERNDVNGGIRLPTSWSRIFSARRMPTRPIWPWHASRSRTNKLEPGRRTADGRCCASTSDPELALVARLRLARVELAQGTPDQALKTLDAVNPGAFAARYAQVRGDALLAKGDRDGALKAYREARRAATTTDVGLLDLKIDELARS